MKSTGKARLIVVLLIALLLSVLTGYAGTHLDRAQLARWFHQWQHSGMSVKINLAAAVERWQDVQAERLVVDEARLSDSSEIAPPSRPRIVSVSNVESLLKAIKRAQPGDRIRVASGDYSFSGRSITLSRSGTVTNPITIEAEQLWQSRFQFDLLEGFWVTGSDWHFDGLHIEGVCVKDDRCEHAFHIVGGASRTVIRNSRIVDFNAPIKINGSKGFYPDDGRIFNNAIMNRRPRDTKKPVVGVDGVAVNDWQVSHNLIANFRKAQGNRTSSGGFFKGGGRSNRFDNNLIICSEQVRMDYIQIGLSLGNGGTSSAACRNGRCLSEQFNSDIVGNIIANCSDVGIYLNRASGSTLTNNTLYATLGIDVRFDVSDAVVVNNLLSGRIRERDDGKLTVDSHSWIMPAQHLLRESFDDLFRHPQQLDFSLRADDPHRFESVGNNRFSSDACGNRNESSKGFVGALNPWLNNDCFATAR